MATDGRKDAPRKTGAAIALLAALLLDAGGAAAMGIRTIRRKPSCYRIGRFPRTGRGPELR